MTRPEVVSTRSWGFWLLVLAATLNNMTNAGSGPVTSHFVQNDLGGSAALAGFVVAIAAFSSMIAMPISGYLTDRFGVNPVLVVSAVITIAGMAVLFISLLIPALLTNRIVFGGANSAVATAMTAWVVIKSPQHERGRALTFFGLSVWVGLALGPAVADNVYRVWDFQTVVLGAVILQSLSLLLCLCVKSAPPASRMPLTRSSHQAQRHFSLAEWAPTFRIIWMPGIVALFAWAAEGFMIAFMIQHLIRNGVPAEGWSGAASVFTVFAIAVIVARFPLGRMPDRLGPLAAVRICLLLLSAGLILLAVAPTFSVAALGAAFLGAAYAPLYPALTMLATTDLEPSKRSTGLGMFSSMTAVGYAFGSMAGGALIALMNEQISFVLFAVFQLVLALLLPRGRPRRRQAGGA